MRKSKASLAVIFGIVFIDLIGFGIVIPVLPLYAERFGASPLVVGCLLAVYSLMQTIFAPILGRWSDRVGRRPVLLISIIGSSLGFLLMGLANSLALLFAGRIIDGITGGNISTAQAYIADVTPAHERSKGDGAHRSGLRAGFHLRAGGRRGDEPFFPLRAAAVRGGVGGGERGRRLFLPAGESLQGASA